MLVSAQQLAVSHISGDWKPDRQQQVLCAYPGVIAFGFQLRDLLFPLQELLPARAELPRQRRKLLQKSGHGRERGERDGDRASGPALPLGTPAQSISHPNPISERRGHQGEH